jgi:hypothetical protein
MGRGGATEENIFTIAPIWRTNGGHTYVSSFILIDQSMELERRFQAGGWEQQFWKFPITLTTDPNLTGILMQKASECQRENSWNGWLHHHHCQHQQDMESTVRSLWWCGIAKELWHTHKHTHTHLTDDGLSKSLSLTNLLFDQWRCDGRIRDVIYYGRTMIHHHHQLLNFCIPTYSLNKVSSGISRSIQIYAIRQCSSSSSCC